MNAPQMSHRGPRADRSIAGMHASSAQTDDPNDDTVHENTVHANTVHDDTVHDDTVDDDTVHDDSIRRGTAGTGRSASPCASIGFADILLEEYRVHRASIEARLAEFRAVPEERYFYELCFCLMTPQSSAAQCNVVALELERRRFLEEGFDAAPLLRAFDGGYVRFHNTKARRLLDARGQMDGILTLIRSHDSDKDVRNKLARNINGIGMKEASHFLRNIGRTDVTIIDRHILRNLVRLGVIDEVKPPSTVPAYLRMEHLFERAAEDLRIPADALDLLLWRHETGFILK